MDTRRSSYVPGERERAEYDLIHQRLDERPAIDDDYCLGVGDLADAVNRSTRTVRRWEKSGDLPPAHRDEKGRRLYTQAQVSALGRLARLAGLLDDRGLRPGQTTFSDAARHAWRDLGCQCHAQGWVATAW
jgi:MerR HTH family regulatory protein